MLTIEVVYTNRLLTPSEASKLKYYKFLCEYHVYKGDILESPMYNTTMQVVGKSDCTNPVQNGITLKRILVDTINGVPTQVLTGNNSNNNSLKTNKMEKKSVLSSFIDKYKSQFIPEKEESLRLSMDGNICVRVGDEYVGITNKNELIAYPTEMCMAIPVYIISKPTTQVNVGDIVKYNNTFLKVLKKNENGSFQGLSFSGYISNKKEIKDFILGQAIVKVVVNMFSGINSGGINPMMFALAEGDNINMKDMMMMQMLQQNGNAGTAGNQMNPMMMMMMLGDNKGGDNSMMEMMMMSQMMGGGNSIFPTMPVFGNNNQEKKD